MGITAEYQNGAKTREFGLGTRPDEVLWERNSEGLFYLLYDGLGSVIAATSENGLVVSRMSYDAFGKVFSESGPAMRYGFTGRPLDETRLQYNRARYYDAGIGRWNRQDDYRGEIAQPASLMRYVYVHNSPVNAMDPSGYVTIDLGKAILDFFTEMSAVLLGLLTTWLGSFAFGNSFLATEKLRKFGGKFGFAVTLLFTLLDVAMVWANGQQSLMCKVMKSIIITFWNTIFFVTAAMLIAIPVVGPGLAFLIVIASGTISPWVTSKWLYAVDRSLNCGYCT